MHFRNWKNFDFRMAAMLDITFLLILPSVFTLALECQTPVHLRWCSDAYGCSHNHVFSPVDYSAKIVSHFYENRRPPLMDAYFVHRLPVDMRDMLYASCGPAVFISDLLVAEAEIGYKGISVQDSPWFQHVLQETSLLSLEYRESVSDIWPFDIALARVQAALAQIPMTPSPRVSFVVCHCRENLEWLVDQIGEIPLNSDLFVYEKCGENNTSVLSNLGVSLKYKNVYVTEQTDGITRGDECTAYLEYIRSEYKRLPDFTIFLQSDLDHHLFVSYLNTALLALRNGIYTIPFLHLNFHRHYQTITPCMRDVENKVFGESVPSELIGTYCCAQFIVSRSRIQARPVEFYRSALAMVDGSMKDICSPVAPRRSSHCYVLEYLWHVIFGESRFLPPKPEDVRLPVIFRMKFGNENVKSRWDDNTV